MYFHLNNLFFRHPNGTEGMLTPHPHTKLNELNNFSVSLQVLLDV